MRPRVLSAAELEVETDLQHVRVRLDAGIRNRDDTDAAGTCWTGKHARTAITEAIVVIFDEAGEPVQEGVFTA